MGWIKRLKLYHLFLFVMRMMSMNGGALLCGQTAYEHLEQGNRYYEVHNFQQALHEYELGFATDTVSDPHFYVLAGTAAEKVGAYEKALILYDKAVEKGVWQDMPYRIYHVYRLMKNNTKAESVLWQAVRERPEEMLLYYRRLFEHYVQTDEPEKAVDVLERLLDSVPDEIGLKRSLAYYHHRLANDSCAAVLHKELAESGNGDFNDYLFLGCYYRLKAEMALVTIDDSLASPVLLKSHMDYARLYRRRHDICMLYLTPALHYLNKACLLQPSDVLEKSIVEMHRKLIIRELRFRSRPMRKR